MPRDGTGGTNMKKDKKIFKVSFVNHEGCTMSAFFSNEKEAERTQWIYNCCNHNNVQKNTVWLSQLTRTIKINSGIAEKETFYCTRKGKWVYGVTHK